MQHFGAMSQGLTRKVTAIGTVGAMGQLMTVYEKNWRCPDCTQENFASRSRCFRCKKAKPEGTDNYVQDAGLDALQKGKEIQWFEAIDPNTYQIYYYNKETGATQWERPEELGPAPVATGWFGRGTAGSNATKQFAELNAKYVSRPARKQKDFIDPKRSIHEVGTDYNIWYGKYLSDFSDHTVNKDPASDRCHLETDAGYTKADNIKATGSSSQKKDRRFFCLHFAHGVCAKGVDCPFYHRIPTPEDDAKCDELFDCFGRAKHNKHRDDMNGVGSFMKPCRTLYVGNLQKNKYDTPKALEDALWKHFSEWGEMENCNVIHRLSIAFPRYRFRTSAEFAKEAMSNQALDHGEVLMIRWAYDDPNPVAQDSIARADKDAIASLLLSKGISLEQAPFQYPDDYQLPTKKIRVDDAVSDAMNEYLAVNPEFAYPDTAGQYAASNTLAIANEISSAPSAEAQAAAYHSLYQSFQPYDQQQPQTSQTTSVSEESEQPKASSDATTEPSKGNWTEHVDPDTGATYFYNESTGESSWSPP